MKTLPCLAAAAILAGAPLSLAGPAAAQSTALPGIADEETTIRSGWVEEFVPGKGDVLFVRDRVDRWYRVQLNQGCLRGSAPVEGLAFEPGPATGAIDRFTSVRIAAGLGRTCSIESIRRSAVPPQKDSASPVTLD
jgi:hypothetical protein